MGDFLRRKPQITMAQFHAFRDARSEGEHWELIDGVPMMMAPWTVMHQRLGRNLEFLLNARLEVVKPEWQVDRQLGVLLEGDEKYNPEPDVLVIDTEIQLGQRYVERFYFVCEVRSQSDDLLALDAKLAYYKAHKDNLCVLLLEQESLQAEQHSRVKRGWRKRKLDTPDAVLDLPQIGIIGRLGDLYRLTPLDPFR